MPEIETSASVTVQDGDPQDSNANSNVHTLLEDIVVPELPLLSLISSIAGNNLNAQSGTSHVKPQCNANNEGRYSGDEQRNDE
jgi:hypothetical protein